MDKEKSKLEETSQEIKNKEYGDYDSIIIQLNNGEESIGNIKMMRQDLEIMMKLHGESRGNILDLLVQTIESESPKIKEYATQRELGRDNE
jgi:hypothetical protein